MIRDILEKRFEKWNSLSQAVRESQPHINCCEYMLMGANAYFDLNLSPQLMKIGRGFGGGMKVESSCGAITGGVMVLSLLYEAREDFDDLVGCFIRDFRSRYKTIECGPLKDQYRDEVTGCQEVILMAADVLDTLIRRVEGAGNE